MGIHNKTYYIAKPRYNTQYYCICYCNNTIFNIISQTLSEIGLCKVLFFWLGFGICMMLASFHMCGMWGR